MPPIEFIGIRGGHGTTTVALATAVTLAARVPARIAAHEPTTLLTPAGIAADGLPLDLADQLELATDRADSDVIDAGSLDHYDGDVSPEGRLRVGVLRGPDYLGPRTLCDHPEASVDGLVVVSEPGRALDARDVEAVSGIPVVAVVDHSPAVARAIDAGLFVHRVARCREFTLLLAWLNELVVESPWNLVAS